MISRENKSMKLWKIVGIAFLLQACDTAEIQTTVLLESVSENTPSITTEKHKALIHEFNVDLFSSSPIHVRPTAYISGQDTYVISLKTLDYLKDEKEFTLIQADQITHSGMPKIIAPKGYSVRLKIRDNQVVALIKSTTPAEAPSNPTLINIDNNDITVGDITATQQLLTVGMMKDFAWNGSFNGLKRKVTPLHQYVSYGHSNRWHALFSKTRIGADITWAAAINQTWQVHEKTYLSVSVQHLYDPNNQTHLHTASLNYVAALSSWVVGQLALSTTLDSFPQPALGGGIRLSPLQALEIHLNAIQTTTLWRLGVSLQLDL